MFKILVLLWTTMFPLTAIADTPAHYDRRHGKPATADSRPEETAFGRAFEPKEAKRTVRIDMGDAMRYSPSEIEVRKNDTVRFVVKNSGRQMHEMVLGTMAELKKHAELMRKHASMEHDDAWMVHVAPGKTAELGWQFTKPGTYYYGCLIPGHFEAGMIGKVIVRP